MEVPLYVTQLTCYCVCVRACACMRIWMCVYMRVSVSVFAETFQELEALLEKKRKLEKEMRLVDVQIEAKKLEAELEQI